jgi:hypothetical protein
VSLDYQVDFHSGAIKQTKMEAHSLAFTPPLRRAGECLPGRVRLFHDGFLLSGMSELSVALRSPAGYGGVLVLILQGSSECATFDGYIGSVYAVYAVYAVLAISAIHLWLRRLRLRDFREWGPSRMSRFCC